IVVVLLCASFTVDAAAQSREGATSSRDPAAAQALFYEARSLMESHRYAEACPKLEESLRLDYGIGTDFNLAQCHERVGRIASAWAEYLNAAAAAKSKN